MRKLFWPLTLTTCLTLGLALPANADDETTAINSDDGEGATVEVEANYKGPETVDTTPTETVTINTDTATIQYTNNYTPPPNVEIHNDYRITYTEDGATIQTINGTGATALIDGLTQSETEDNPEEDQPEINPEILAIQSINQMQLQAPQISSTPDNPDVLGAVGLPVWFWINNPNPNTTGPKTVTATAGPVTVTATATFKGLQIKTGDGNTITCKGPGTPYPGTGINPSPDCGHTYYKKSNTQPNGLYNVEIQALWDVNWTSTTGTSGTIPIALTTQKQLNIGSYQAVVTQHN